MLKHCGILIALMFTQILTYQNIKIMPKAFFSIKNLHIFDVNMITFANNLI